MAAKFPFELVAPARLVFTGEVTQVDVPGVEGDFGVLAGHSPLVATIKPGILTVFNGGEPQRFVVLGGFAEVSPGGLTILADAASTLAEADRPLVADRIRELEALCAKTPPGPALDRESEKLEQFRALDRMLQGGVAAHEAARH
jgi:F-type H+-transporting ATPase subunit epsilon